MFFFFFLIIYLYFLVLAVTVQIFDPIAELVTPIGVPSKEAKSETLPVISETKVRKCSVMKFLFLLYFSI